MKLETVDSLEKGTVNKILGQNKGQLLVEYILLIFIVVVIATLLTSALVGRGDGNMGMIIGKWAQLLELVGQDIGD